jgi:hypothetical protein
VLAAATLRPAGLDADGHDGIEDKADQHGDDITGAISSGQSAGGSLARGTDRGVHREI